MNTREEKIRMWFDMWLKKTDHGIMDLFSFDAVYIYNSSQIRIYLLFFTKVITSSILEVKKIS